MTMRVRSLQARFFASDADLRAYVMSARGLAGRADDAPPVEPEADDSARAESPAVIAWDRGSWWLDGGQEYGTREDALDALEQTAWFRDALARKRKPADLAEPRWFDAAAVEDMPSAYDGSQVGEDAIDAMVRNLAAERTPIMIDGGNVSEVHESVWNGSARAAGWGYVAVKLLDEEARAHLYLYGALLPEVDEQVDARQIQFGSIAFIDDAEHRYSGEPIGARLISYALTNTPFIDGLEPHAARSQAPAGGRRLAITRSRKAMATKKTARNAPESVHEQPAAPQPADVRAEPAPVDAPAEREDMAPEAAAMLAEDMLSELRRLSGMDDAEPAAILDMLKGMADGALKGEEPEDDNAGEGGTPVSAASEGARAVDVRSAEMRAEAIGLRARVTELEARVSQYESAEKRLGYERHLDAQLATIRRSLAPAQRTELLEMAMAHPGDGKRLLDIAVKGINVPPQGVVLTPKPGAAAPTGTTGEGMTKAAFLEAVRAELVQADPSLLTSKEGKEKLRKQTYAVAKSRNAALLASND